MNKPEMSPAVHPDSRGVAFTVVVHGKTVACIVTREALERHFWLEPAAPDDRLLKIFCDGSNRLRAVAERKLLSQGDSNLTLTPTDFVGR